MLFFNGILLELKRKRKEQEKKHPAVDEGVARKYQANKIKRQHWNQC